MSAKVKTQEGIKASKGLKPLKIIRNLFISVVVLFVLVTLGVFVNDYIASNHNKKILEEQGYINLVSAGGYELNARVYGDRENPEHIIVGISGLGCTDTSVTFSNCLEGISENNLIILIDRAGYGYSEDTTTEQTVEQIVGDYRTVLGNLGIEGPYILLSHSIGGIYATYWESIYPEEVEAMIMLDTTTVTDKIAFDEEDIKVGKMDYVSAFFSKLGWGRIVYKNYRFPLSDVFSEEQKRYSEMLYANQLRSYAVLSETELMNDNCSFVYEHTQTNDIPKLYICAGYSFSNVEEVREYFIYANERVMELSNEVYFDMSDEAHFCDVANRLIENASVFTDETVKPYVEKLGNVTQVNIPGDHCIYEQKPHDVGREIEIFLDSL